MEPKSFPKEKMEIVAHNQKDLDMEGWKDYEIHVGYFYGIIEEPTTRFGTHRAAMSELCNFKSEDFLVRSQDKDGSHPFGFGPDRVLKFDYTKKEINELGLTATKLRNMGYNASECKSLGFSASDCRLAGFSAEELYELCVQPKDFGFLKPGMILVCRNQEPCQNSANLHEEVGYFISKFTAVDSLTGNHRIDPVRDYWQNQNRLRSQNDKGFFPYGFGPDRILKFDD